MTHILEIIEQCFGGQKASQWKRHLFLSHASFILSPGLEEKTVFIAEKLENKNAFAWNFPSMLKRI